MYRLKSNRLKVEFVISRRLLVFKKYQAIAEKGDVIVHFDNKVSCVFAKEDFLRVTDPIVERVEKKRERKR